MITTTETASAATITPVERDSDPVDGPAGSPPTGDAAMTAVGPGGGPAFTGNSVVAPPPAAGTVCVGSSAAIGPRGTVVSPKAGGSTDSEEGPPTVGSPTSPATPLGSASATPHVAQ